jgi:limonene-1,2-epoxide hydrolase
MAVDARTWIEAYGNAWREKDGQAAAALFTEDGVYRSSPFRAPHAGRDQIRAYWEQETEHQRDFELRFGEPVVEGKRVTVEWWATMRDQPWAASEGFHGDPAITLPGCLILRFTPDGLCEELREYWHVRFGDVMSPLDGWGR